MNPKSAGTFSFASQTLDVSEPLLFEPTLQRQGADEILMVSTSLTPAKAKLVGHAIYGKEGFGSLILCDAIIGLKVDWMDGATDSSVPLGVNSF